MVPGAAESDGVREGSRGRPLGQSPKAQRILHSRQSGAGNQNTRRDATRGLQRRARPAAQVAHTAARAIAHGPLEDDGRGRIGDGADADFPDTNGVGARAEFCGSAARGLGVSVS